MMLSDGPETRFPSAAQRLTIDGRAVRTRQRLHALVTLVIPLLGMLGAITSLLTHRVRGVDITLLVGMYTVTMMGVDVGYHRLFSHRSFKAHPLLRAMIASRSAAPEEAWGMEEASAERAARSVAAGDARLPR